MQLMGGEEIFINKLDTLFHEGLYWHGNEPGHHIVYLYNWGQEPWKTQRWVREIMASEYGTGPGGLSGNDDTGQMSAWYVFSALGMYPVAPGVPFYAIGTPTFEKAAIQVGANGTFTIRANNVSEENMYIQSATLNGEPFNRTFIWHNEITAGGELVFEMGDIPAETWGIGADAVPPSMSD
jgi:predicted alpha-1,2-mannosidase